MTNLMRAEDGEEMSLDERSEETFSGDAADHLMERSSMDDDEISHSEIQPSHKGVRAFLGVLFRTKGAPQIIVLALAYSLAIGPLVSAVPDVMEDRYARLLHNYDGPHCSSFDRADKPVACLKGGDNAQNAAAESAFVQNIIILLSNSVVGSMSDCRGRKSFLAFGFSLAALAPAALLLLQIVESMNPIWYFAADASSGLVGILSVSFTMLSDLMAPSHRAPSIGVYLAAFKLGFALSQILAYYMGHIAVSAFAVAILVAAIFFSLLAVPETLPDDARNRALSRRRQSDDGIATCLGIVLRPIHEMSILNRNRLFRTLAAVTFCTGFVYTSDATLFVYYVEDSLGVSYQDVASMFLPMALLGILVMVFVLKPAVRTLGEKGLLVVTCLCGAAHNALYGVAASRTIVFVALCASEFTSLTFPVQISMRSNLVDETEQGRVQGAFQSLTAVADAVGPMVLQLIYHRTEHGALFGPGTMFLFAALVYFSGGLLSCSLPAKQVNSRTRSGDDLCSDSLESAEEPLLASENSSFSGEENST